MGAGAGVFANDLGTSVRSGGSTQPAHGALTLALDGGFTYVPDAGFTGTDSFTYTLTDLVGATDTATVSLRVGTASSAFVRAAHIDFLDRGPTATEQRALDAALGNGSTTRRAVITELATSDEWIGVIVGRMYRDTLDRAGDPGGVAFWTKQLRTGRRTVAQAAAEFYASNEYFRRVGGTNAAWVADLYPKLLGRPADPGGQAYWVAQTVRTGRPRVAGRFFQSLESRRGRVARLYQDLLGRGPDPGGREFWAGKIEAQGDIALAIELASSEEYQRRAGDRFP